MPSISFEPLDAKFGLQVNGLDLTRPIAQRVLSQLTNALMQHKVLLVRDQHITTQQYADFGRSWAPTTRIDSFHEMHVPGFDDINQVGNVGRLFENEEYRNGASFWHTDCAAESDPDATTMLYCLEAPASDGETVIADMQAAYLGLDHELRERIEHLTASHCYAGAKPIIGGREDWEHSLTPVSEETRDNFPSPVTRPVVRRHSVTGVKGLYAPAGSIFSIDGMETEQANKLMRTIKLQSTQAEFCYSHQYRPGDLLMWDNTSTMHYGKPVSAATNKLDRRLLYRISPLGIPFGCSRYPL